MTEMGYLKFGKYGRVTQHFYHHCNPGEFYSPSLNYDRDGDTDYFVVFGVTGCRFCPYCGVKLEVPE